MRIARFLPIIIALGVVVACRPQEQKLVPPTQPTSSSAPSTEALEQVPSELTIRHFSTMKLEGTGLTLDVRTESNAAYDKYNIHYLSNGLKITGVFLMPKGAGPFPLLILNHGHIDTAVYTQGRGLKREQDSLARAGFAVLHTDYRGHAGSDKSPMPEDDSVYDGNLEYAMDSANAILAVRAAKLPRVDATKVGMLGHSMGGGVTLAVLTGRPDLVSAAVLYAPVHADAWENFDRWRRLRDEGDRTIEKFGTRAEHPEIWDALSPKTYLKNIVAPVLLFQGGKDNDVPEAWSDTLDVFMKAAGRDIEYVEYPDEPHEFIRKWPDFMERTAAFFHDHLAQGDAAEDFLLPLSAERVTKKPFGLKVDPKNSPVSPEKFTGYHTGTDFETTDADPADVAVRAACTGEILYKGTVSGYGGVVVTSCMHQGQNVTALYGHLRLSSVSLGVGDELSAGTSFAVLGTGYSPETDGERRHLHFSLHRGSSTELRGYVQTEDALKDWIKVL